MFSVFTINPKLALNRYVTYGKTSVNPITGGWGGGANRPSRLVFLLSTENGDGDLKFLDFSYTFIGNVAPNFWVSTLRRGASRTTFSGAWLPSFGQFFLQIFGNYKNLIVCDGLVYWETCPEIWPKSFKKQPSYDNFKHLVKKSANVIFSPLNPKIFEFLDFRKRILYFTMREIEWRLPHRNRPYDSRDLKGAESPPPPPHQLTSSRKPTSNRVKLYVH